MTPEIQVEMETRRCVTCKRTFRVMTRSQQSACSMECGSYGSREPGVRKSLLKYGEPKKESVTVGAIKPMMPLEKGKLFEARVGAWPNQKKNQKEEGEAMRQTRKLETNDEPNGQNRTEKDKTPVSVPLMPEVGIKGSSELAKVATPEIHPELSDASVRNLETAALDSMTLLKASSNKLLQLMNESVSATDLARSEEGVQSVPPHKIQNAIECAKAIATTIQTQVNMVKALSGFRRDK